MYEIVTVLVCLIFNALLAAYEMAFVAMPKPELRSLARSGNRDARRLLLLRENPERTLSVIQIGITLVGAVAAAIGGAGASDNLEPYFVSSIGLSTTTAELLALLIVVLPITYLSVVIGELVPKTLALRNPRKIVMAGAKILFLADRALFPVVSVLEWSTKKILRVFFTKSRPQQTAPQTSIDIEGFSPVHQRFMLNMADIEKKRIRDIMLPWAKVNSVKDTATVEEVAQVVLSSAHTRLPVTNDGQVLGILHAKEFSVLKESGERNWLPIIRPAIKLQPSDSALGVLRHMQAQRTHMAIVFSTNGERLGIVTLEDILEEIVGDIFDEDDDGKVRRVFFSRARSRVLPEEL